MNILIISTVVFVTNFHSSFGVRYDSFQVYRIQPHNENSVKFLQKLEDNPDYDLWSDIDVMVAPQAQSEFEQLINEHNLNLTIFIENVQQLIDIERIPTRNSGFDWRTYHSLDDINTWLTNLTVKYPDKVSLLKIGKSYEGRDIIGVKLSYSPLNANRSVFLEGNIHAREWISSAVVTYILNELLTSSDPKIKAIAHNNDWYVFPVVNPDGFVYSHKKDRVWRKTRVPYGLCYGADPNRNWGHHFNEGGTVGRPCSDLYRGPYPFSEPCTKRLSDFIATIAGQLRAYIAFHSYSQLLLMPYGYTRKHLDNYEDLYKIGSKAIKSLAKRYGTRYTMGNVAEILYVASGGSMDWVKGTFKTPITYTYELRDTGKFGFLLPPDQIIPTGQETLDSLVTIIEEFDKILG